MKFKWSIYLYATLLTVWLDYCPQLYCSASEVNPTAAKTLISVQALSKYKTQSVTVKEQGKKMSYLGVSLRSLLAEQIAGIDTMADWKKLAKDRLVVEVLGADGFPALITATELAMNSSGDKFILATICNGTPLTEGIKLVCPSDDHHVRCVRQVQSMRLIHVPES